MNKIWNNFRQKKKLNALNPIEHQRIVDHYFARAPIIEVFQINLNRFSIDMHTFEEKNKK